MLQPMTNLMIDDWLWSKWYFPIEPLYKAYVNKLLLAKSTSLP